MDRTSRLVTRLAAVLLLCAGLGLADWSCTDDLRAPPPFEAGSADGRADRNPADAQRPDGGKG